MEIEETDAVTMSNRTNRTKRTKRSKRQGTRKKDKQVRFDLSISDAPHPRVVAYY